MATKLDSTGKRVVKRKAAVAAPGLTGVRRISSLSDVDLRPAANSMIGLRLKRWWIHVFYGCSRSKQT